MSDEIELVVGSLRGYRWWRVGQGGWLVSPWRGRERWGPSLNRARCLFRRRLMRWETSRRIHPSGAPVAACDCGYYGLYDLPRIRDRMVGLGWEIGVGSSGARHGLVFGVAQAHGRVVIGTQGWRAEYARPLVLLWGPEAEPDARLTAILERYRIPVVRSMVTLVREWGPDDLERDLLAG